MSKTKLLSGLLAISLMGGITSAYAANGYNTVETMGVYPVSHSNLKTQEAVSTVARMAYKEIIRARSALKDKDLQQAEESVKQAHTLLNIARNASPVEEVKDNLWIAKKHLEIDTDEVVKADLVPIEASLMDLETMMPVEEVSQHVQDAKTALNQGDKKKAKEALQLAENQFMYSEFSLPLGHALAYVNQAEIMLGRKNWSEADAALKTAEQGVRFSSYVDQVPTASAQKSLWQAATDYGLKDYQSARAQLHMASRYINKTSMMGDQKLMIESQKLLSDINQLDQKLKTGDRFDGEQITALYQRSAALAQYEKGLMSVALEMPENQSVKKQLLTAQLNLALAESYQLTAKNEASAKTSLMTAQHSLKEAALTASPSEKGSINVLQQDVKMIQTGFGDDSDAIRNSYSHSRHQLDKLIMSL